MTIRQKTLIIFSILLIILIGLGVFVIYNVSTINKYLSRDVPQAITQVNNASYLDSIAQLIRYDDEVLTQSARNYAFTGDVKWKNRYNEFVPKLDMRIKTALEKGDTEDKKIFKNVDQANLALVDMEVRSLALVDEDKRTEAQTILDGPEYAAQKAIYKDGVDQYLLRRGTQADEALTVSTDLLTKTNQNVKKMTSTEGWLFGILTLVILFLLGLLYYIIFYSIIVPLNLLRKASEEIAQGDLTQKVIVKSNDEIGALGHSFNKMAKDLQASQTNIEAKINERTQQLTKLNRFMTGREIKMIELKKKIEELENKNSDEVK